MGLGCIVGEVSADVRVSSSKEDCFLASHALVFMIRSLTSNWKQVVAYYLTGNSINGLHLWNIVCEIISQLRKSDINVRALVSDMGSCNRAMWKVAGIGVSRE